MFEYALLQVSSQHLLLMHLRILQFSEPLEKKWYNRLCAFIPAYVPRYKLSVRPVYKELPKIVSAQLWRCCPGHGGSNCEDTGISQLLFSSKKCVQLAVMLLNSNTQRQPYLFGSPPPTHALIPVYILLLQENQTLGPNDQVEIHKQTPRELKKLSGFPGLQPGDCSAGMTLTVRDSISVKNKQLHPQGV